MTTNRSSFNNPSEVSEKIKTRLKELSLQNIQPDTITFVPSGEPTLDKNLGKMIQLVKEFGVQTAVITNASLLWHPDTGIQLTNSDIVSLKVDSIIEETWHKIDHPHGSLKLDLVLNGIQQFAKAFKGKLITETMLIKGLNDSNEEAKPAAAFIADLHPETAFLALPLRPPAESWVQPPREDRLMAVYNIFSEWIAQVELLMDLPKTELISEDNPIHTLLNTLQVHPLSKNEIQKYLESNQLGWEIIQQLIKDNILKSVTSQDTEFIIHTY